MSILVEQNDNINKILYNNDEYLDIIKDIVFNPIVLEMKNYMQHGFTSCYEHSIYVSYYSYLIAKELGFDYKSVARAGMLHDLFLYDWHVKSTKNEPLFKKHGFIHPQIALENASKYFELNKIEKDCILKHMWPLTIKFPMYKEAYVLTFVDKYSSIIETVKGLKKLKYYFKNMLRYI